MLESTPQRTQVIIDTDPGVDDAIAILMALSCPQFEVIGLTTTAGNVPLARATRNVLALLEHVGRSDIPVFRGAARPVRGRFAYARHVHSAAGLTRRLPEPTTPPSDTSAVRFLADTITAATDPVTLIALGPLTNLARLLRRHPAALRTAGRIVVMGGAVETPGNATPHSEFNFFSDPTAARQVIESGVPIELIDLAPCRRVYFSRTELNGITGASRAGTLAAEMLAGWFRKDAGRERFNLYDPLAVAAAIDPNVLRTRRVTLAVDDSDTTDNPSGWGRCRITNATAGPISVSAAEGVDSQRALNIISDLLEWR